MRGCGRQDSALAQILLQLQQLAHEVQIGRDDRPGHFHQLVGLQQGERLVPHDVGDGNGGAPRNPRVAVQQHSGTRFPCIFCKISRGKGAF